jgi:hypothetical protein
MKANCAYRLLHLQTFQVGLVKLGWHSYIALLALLARLAQLHGTAGLSIWASEAAWHSWASAAAWPSWPS